MSWTYLNDERPKARKPHRCYLCSGVIEPGETYVRRTGVGDYGIESTPMHVECEAVTQSWEEDDWETFWAGDLERPAKVAAIAEGGGD